MSNTVIWNDFKNKGRKAEIFVEGKTLHEISQEYGIEEYIVRNRYRRNGIRDIAGLTKPKSKSRSVFRRTYNIYSSGRRMMEAIYAKGVTIKELSQHTEIEESTIYKFLQDGRDISSMRLAKLCKYLGVSMDYVMGLKEKPDGKM